MKIKFRIKIQMIKLIIQNKGLPLYTNTSVVLKGSRWSRGDGVDLDCSIIAIVGLNPLEAKLYVRIFLWCAVL